MGAEYWTELNNFLGAGFWTELKGDFERLFTGEKCSCQAPETEQSYKDAKATSIEQKCAGLGSQLTLEIADA